MSVFRAVITGLNSAKDEAEVVRIFHANGFSIEKMYNYCGKDFIEVKDHRCEATFYRDEVFWYVSDKKFYKQKFVPEDGGYAGAMIGFYVGIMGLFITGSISLLVSAYAY